MKATRHSGLPPPGHHARGRCGFVTRLLGVLAGGALAATNEPTGWTLPKDVPLGPGKLDLGAAVRVRREYFENFDLKKYGTGQNDDLTVTRLWFDIAYRLDADTKLFVRLQDARFWSDLYDEGDFVPACPHENALDLREGYLEWHHIGDTPFGVKLGRQLIWYGDELVWGCGDWANSGKCVWDAAKVLCHFEDSRLDLIYARRVVSDANGPDRRHEAFEAFSAYLSAKGLPCELDVFYLGKFDTHDTTVGESGTNSLALHAVGSRVFWQASERVSAGGTIVAEFGEWGEDDVQALGGVASGTYTVEAPWTPAVTLAYAYASGDDDPHDGVHGTFDPLFGSTHAPFGLMDLTSWMNLHDYQVDLRLKPPWLTALVLSYHRFQLVETKDAWYFRERALRRDTAGTSGQDLGHEINVLLKKQVSPRLRMEAAYGHFFAGDFAKATEGGGDADWAYVQATLTF